MAHYFNYSCCAPLYNPNPGSGRNEYSAILAAWGNKYGLTGIL